MNKTDYILKSLQKISHKKWELFVISRIIHKLDDPQIDFVTQQLVRLPNGRRALTDLYFPQLAIHLEVDERHHFEQNAGDDLGLSYVPDDQLREQDIVQITGHELHRICVCNENGDLDFSTVAQRADDFVGVIRARKQAKLAQGQFEPWDFEARFDPKRIIERGRLAIADNVLFRRQVDAMRCFGFNGNGYQRGVWTIPDGSGDVLWFPRLYRHGMWHNELVDGGTTITTLYQRANDEDGRASIRQQRETIAQAPNRRFIVFAKGKDPLGTNLLRYVGVFMPDPDALTDDMIKFNRVQDEIDLPNREARV